MKEESAVIEVDVGGLHFTISYYEHRATYCVERFNAADEVIEACDVPRKVFLAMLTAARIKSKESAP